MNEVPDDYREYQEERDEVLKPPRRPPPSEMPTYELLASIVNGGQAGRLVDALSNRWTAMTVAGAEKARMLEEVLKANADRGLPELIDAVFLAMIEFDARLLLRRQLRIGQMMAEADRAMSMEVQAPPPEAVKELDRLLGQEERLVDLAERYARVRHVLKLAGVGERPWTRRREPVITDTYRPPVRDPYVPSPVKPEPRCAPETRDESISMRDRPAESLPAFTGTPS